MLIFLGYHFVGLLSVLHPVPNWYNLMTQPNWYNLMSQPYSSLVMWILKYYQVDQDWKAHQVLMCRLVSGSYSVHISARLLASLTEVSL